MPCTILFLPLKKLNNTNFFPQWRPSWPYFLFYKFDVWPTISHRKMRRNLDNLRWNFKQYIADCDRFLHYRGLIINIFCLHVYISDPKISRVPSRPGLFPYVQTRPFHVRYVVNDDFTMQRCWCKNERVHWFYLHCTYVMCTPYIQVYFPTVHYDFHHNAQNSMCMQYFSADELTTGVKNMQQPPSIV